MNERVQALLKEGRFVSDGERYRLIKMPANAVTVTAGVVAEIGEGFMVLVVDKEAVTLILEDEAYEEYQGRLHGHQVAEIVYRLITFEAVLPLDLVGFMAVIAEALADDGVSLLAYGSYDYDHWLVPEDDFDLAMTTLKQLQDIS